MTAFAPRFTITHPMTGAVTARERARGFLEAAARSEQPGRCRRPWSLAIWVATKFSGACRLRPGRCPGL
jgi:hypothetical protein